MAGDRVLTVRIAGDAKGGTKAIGEVTGASVGLGKKLLKLGGLMAGITFGKNLITDIKNVGSGYAKTMNVFQATTRATEKEMDAVGARARELGSDFDIPGTSASDAGGAMLELAKGGLSVKDSMDAAKGSLLLAAAAGISGAEAAEIQAAAISQFNLKAGDAAGVADTLANVADAAAGSINDAALALSYVGPVAQAVSMDIESTGTAIGLLHKNAILGNKAGTSLRAIIAGLANPSEKAGAALEKLGVVAFDNQGKFVGMRKVTQQLARAKKRLTEEEFAAAGAAAFGREPLAAINALANEGVKGWDGMAEAVGREGSAADVAKGKNKGFGGAVDKLHGQLEDLYITIWEKVAPGLTKMTNKSAKVVGAFGNLLQGTSDLTSGLKDFDGKAFGDKIVKMVKSALDRLGDLASTLMDSIRDMFKGVDWVGLGIELGKAAVPMLVGLALGILNFDLVGLLEGLANHWQAVLLGILTIALAPAKWIAQLSKLLRKIPFVGKFLAWIVEAINKIGGKFKSLFKDFFKSFGEGFKQALGWTGPGLIVRLVKFFAKMRGKIVEWAGLLATRMGVAALDMAKRFGNWLGRHGPAQALAAIRKIKSKITGFFSAAGEWLSKHGGRIVNGLTGGIRGAFGKMMELVRSVKGKITGALSNAGSWLYNAGSSVISGFINGIKSKFADVKNTLADLTGKLTSWKGPEKRDKVLLTPAGQMVIDGFDRGLSSRFGKVRKSLAGFTADIGRDAASASANAASGLRGSPLAASAGAGGTSPLRAAMRPSTGGPVTVVVKVAGNLIGEKDFAKRITPVVRDEFKKIGDRNGGRIYG